MTETVGSNPTTSVEQNEDGYLKKFCSNVQIERPEQNNME